MLVRLSSSDTLSTRSWKNIPNIFVVPIIKMTDCWTEISFYWLLWLQDPTTLNENFLLSFICNYRCCEVKGWQIVSGDET